VIKQIWVNENTGNNQLFVTTIKKNAGFLQQTGIGFSPFSFATVCSFSWPPPLLILQRPTIFVFVLQK